MGSRALSDALAPGWAALGAPAAGVWADPTHAVCDHALLCPALPCSARLSPPAAAPPPGWQSQAGLRCEPVTLPSSAAAGFRGWNNGLCPDRRPPRSRRAVKAPRRQEKWPSPPRFAALPTTRQVTLIDRARALSPSERPASAVSGNPAESSPAGRLSRRACVVSATAAAWTRPLSAQFRNCWNSRA